MTIDIRATTADERATLHDLHRRAFGGTVEADLVLALLDDEAPTISLGAHDGSRLLGHVLFSGLEGPPAALALAPVAVDPDMQGQGIGGTLIRAGLEEARKAGWQSVFVLGEPAYYGRFGFRAELAAGAICAWSGPYLQALELTEGALKDYSGPLEYAAPFQNLS
jgi:putative acetyltransferase